MSEIAMKTKSIAEPERGRPARWTRGRLARRTRARPPVVSFPQ